MLKIALPKGRMGDKVYSMFERIGLSCREIKEDNRTGQMPFWQEPLPCRNGIKITLAF